MNVQQHLKKIAKEFDLQLNPKKKFKYVVLTKRVIIISTFLSDCHDPIYVKHGNQKKDKISVNLMKYLKTKDYREEIKKPQGRVISKEELKEELSHLSKFRHTPVGKETEKMYAKIKERIGNSKRITLIWKPSQQEEKSQIRKEILLHEFMHELLEENKIRPKSWKWNEGLVTYLTYFALGKSEQIEGWYVTGKEKIGDYIIYAKKWAKLLKKIKDPKNRKYRIINKIKKIERKK